MFSCRAAITSERVLTMQVLENRPRNAILGPEIAHDAVGPDTRAGPLHDADADAERPLALALVALDVKEAERLDPFGLSRVALVAQLFRKRCTRVKPRKSAGCRMGDPAQDVDKYRVMRRGGDRPLDKLKRTRPPL